MKRRYAVCGVSQRAIGMFLTPMVNAFAEHCEVAALLDADKRRFRVCKAKLPAVSGAAEYGPDDFARMVEETQPDTIVVAGRDDTHARYIVQALERDLDVIAEKPMATTARDCRAILEAEAASRGRVTVAFNYRYNPVHRKIKEMVLDGKLGRITSVDLNWYIDTYHGSSYFMRWNRMRAYSGGLSIHKSAHHFDLVQWWLGQRPVEAFAYGALNYYGPDSEYNPGREDGRHCGTCRVRGDCAYYARWHARSGIVAAEDDHVGRFGGGDAEEAAYTGYRPDMCIYDSDIQIEDTYTATVRYDQGALLSYSVNFSLPYEGYRLAINGTRGRLETTEYHAPSRISFPIPERQAIEYYPLFGARETIYVVQREGGHGGGDPALQEDLFLGVDPGRPYPILSGSQDGAYAVAAGEAVWRSARTGKPIRIADLLDA